MVIFHFPLYFYTNWNYTLRKSCLFSPIHLINGTVDSWMFILFCGLKFNNSVALLLKFLHLWLLEEFLHVGSFILSTNPHLFVRTSLLCGTTRCSGFILWTPCPIFGSNHFSKGPALVFNWRMVFRIHDLGAVLVGFLYILYNSVLR